MKKLISALAVLLIASVALAVPPSPPPPVTGLLNYTVATLPSASGTPNLIVVVTDGNATNDCSTGTGTTRVVCISNGSAWTSPVGSGLTEVQDEAFSAANFNGDATHAVSQNNFYDYVHIADTDDDGLPNKVDLSTAGVVLTDASGVLSSEAALAMARGGLGADVSAYAGLVKISGGVASAVTVTAYIETLLNDAAATDARATLELVPGTNVQAYDAELAALAGLTSAADRLPYFTGLGTAALATFTAYGRSLIDDADAATAQATLGLVIGVNVQAYNANLDDLADGSLTATKIGITGATAITSRATDDELLVYNVSAGANRKITVGNFISGLGGGASSIILDLLDDGNNESAGISEIAVTSDTNSIFTEPTADKLLIDVSKRWPTADVAVQAQTGDSATSFFSTGTIEHERGGLEANVSAYDGLVKISAGATSAVTITSFGTTFIALADASAARTNLGLAIGTNVQAYNADLADLADGSLTGSKVGTGISATNVTTGTLPDGQLSSNVPLKNGANTFTGNNVFGDGDTDTLTLRSLLVGGNSRAVQVTDTIATPTYATTSTDLYVKRYIEAGGGIYAPFIQIINTGGESYIDLLSNAASPTGAGTNAVFFITNTAYVRESGTDKIVVTADKSVTWTGGTHSFAGVTNFILPTADADAAGEISINQSNKQLVWNDGTSVRKITTAGAITNGYVLKWNSTNGAFEPASDDTAGAPIISSVGNPTADTTFTFPAGNEINFVFSGNFTTGSQFLVQQVTGAPSGGTLFEVRGVDSDITLVKLGDGTNGVQVSYTGALTATGSGSITATALSGAVTGATSVAASSYIAVGADPADAGAIRLSNAGYIYSEASPAGTDISVIGVDSSEVVQIAASGASGVNVGAKLTTLATATGTAGFNLPAGTAPTVPADGDVWTTTAGMYVRINGATIGPLAASGAATSVTGANADTITNAVNGQWKLAGVGQTNNEDLILDFETNANQVTFSSSTSVTALNFSALNLVTTGTIDLGHATDTTIARVSAGVISIEGVNVATDSSTNTFTNKTFDANATGNVLKQYSYIQLTGQGFKSRGAGVTAPSTTQTDFNYGLPKFSNSTDEATNWIDFVIQVPPDIDTSVDLTATLQFLLGEADTADHDYVVSMISIAASAAAAGTPANAVNLAYTADGSGANGDYETTAETTLTDWKSNVTAGRLWRIRLARDGDDGTNDASTVDSYPLVLIIKYGSTN
jgi:hypothetical protein